MGVCEGKFALGASHRSMVVFPFTSVYMRAPRDLIGVPTTSEWGFRVCLYTEVSPAFPSRFKERPEDTLFVLGIGCGGWFDPCLEVGNFLYYVRFVWFGDSDLWPCA